MFRRQLGKHATLRVDDETSSGRRWLDTLRPWHPEPGAGTVPSRCLTRSGWLRRWGSGWKVCDEAFWGLSAVDSGSDGVG